MAHHRLSLCGAESLLSAGWGRLFLVLSCVVRSGVERLRPLALSCVLSSHESILCKVINDHVVEFLRQLQDSTEDVHLLAPDYCSVPTTSDWFESTTIVADLVPLLRVEVECPQVSELVIVVVLASEDVEFVVVDDVGVRGSDLGTADVS